MPYILLVPSFCLNQYKNTVIIDLTKDKQPEFMSGF